MRRVILESPWRGDTEANRAYAIKAMIHSIGLLEAPFASHLLYTQFLNEENSKQSALGILLGFAWYKSAEACVVYTDLGISSGMMLGIEEAEKYKLPVIRRKIL